MAQPPDPRALKDKAAEHAAKGNHVKALELYQQIALAEPREPRWLLKIAECYRSRGDAATAARTYHEAARMFSREGFELKAAAAQRVAMQLAPHAAPSPTPMTSASAGASVMPPPVASNPTRFPPAPEAPRRAAVPDAPPPLPAPAAQSPRAPAPRVPPPPPVARVFGTDSSPPPPIGTAPPADAPPAVAHADAMVAPALLFGAVTRGIKPAAVAPSKSPQTLDRIDLSGRLSALGADVPGAGVVDVLIDLDDVLIDPGYEELSPDDVELEVSSSALPLSLVAEPSMQQPAPASPIPADDPFGDPFADPFADVPVGLGTRFRGSSARTAGNALPPRAIDPVRARGLPLLGAIPAEALEGFLRRIEHLEVAAGGCVIRQGDVADNVYLVVSGDLVASHGTPPRVVARLSEGTFFGEMALLDDAPRSATVTAATPVALLVLPREVVLEICDRYPTVLATLMQSLRTRLIASLTNTSPLFAGLPADERGRVVARFRVREIEPDVALIREGERADGLYVVLTGRAAVTNRGLPVATVSTGAVVGEMSLLSSGAAQATVTSLARMTVLVLPAEDFREIIMVYPQVLEHLSSLSDGRDAELRSVQSSGEFEPRTVRRV